MAEEKEERQDQMMITSSNSQKTFILKWSTGLGIDGDSVTFKVGGVRWGWWDWSWEDEEGAMEEGEDPGAGKRIMDGMKGWELDKSCHS